MIDNIRRSFGKGESRREVVHGISMDVPAGRIVCLLGPNGAGKTTTVKMASTLLVPDSGSITICGVDAIREPRRARANLALLLGGESGFYMRVSAIDNLRFFAQLAGVPRRAQETRIREALERVSLADKAGDRVETFSRGMKQRLHIARAMVSHARLVLLDEPSTGLDPESALRMRGLIAAMRDEGAGILLTTHAMPEAEALADRIHVIDGGRIIASGTVRDLAGLVHLDGVTSFVAPPTSIDLERLPDFRNLTNVRTSDMMLRNGVWSIDVVWEGHEPAAGELGVEGATRMGVRPATLEEVYLALLRSHGHERDVQSDGYEEAAR